MTKALLFSMMAALLIGACAPGKINNLYVDSRYQPRRMSHYPYDRPLFVTVAGTAFDIPQAEFNHIVSEAVQAPGFSPPSQGDPYIHFIFNNDVGTSFQGACGQHGIEAPKGKTDGDVGVTAILCQGSETLTYLVASLENTKGPQDEKFRRFLRYIAVRLFPQQSEDTRENGCVISPGC